MQLYNNGASFAASLYNFPVNRRNELNGDLGIYMQDSWRLGRLTLNPGLRFERCNGGVPEQSAPAGRFLPARRFDAVTNLPNYNNWLVRIGGAYDLFGDGKNGAQGQRRPVHAAGSRRFSGAIQPDANLHGDRVVDRSQSRRHR